MIHCLKFGVSVIKIEQDNQIAILKFPLGVEEREFSETPVVNDHSRK